MIRILGIESSCDETAAAVVEQTDDGRLRILSGKVASQIETHRLYGGVVPEIAGRAHMEAISDVVREALTEAAVSPADLTAVAVTTHPGLIGALLVGVSFAKSFALKNHLPLVAVDHIDGHIAASYLTATPPRPPYLALVVSGGHTSLYKVEDYTKRSRIGESRDDAIGESFDKIGRLIGIPYPAGAGFDALAAEGFAQVAEGAEDVYAAFRKSAVYKDPENYLPSPALNDGSLDFSFSGLKTAAINLLHRKEQRGETLDRPLFAARYTFEAVEAVVKKTGAALKANPGIPLVVAGGVAANSHLRARLAALCQKAGCPLILPPLSLCGDNGAMIAAQGIYEYLAGRFADTRLNASAADDI